MNSVLYTSAKVNLPVLFVSLSIIVQKCGEEAGDG